MTNGWVPQLSPLIYNPLNSPNYCIDKFKQTIVCDIAKDGQVNEKYKFK